MWPQKQWDPPESVLLKRGRKQSWWDLAAKATEGGQENVGKELKKEEWSMQYFAIALDKEFFNVISL